MSQFSQFIPTRLYFGAGTLSKLSEIKLPGTKAMVVITCGKSMRKFGYLDKVVEALKAQGVESIIFDKILPNPIKEHVMEAAAICRNEGCDFVVGLGGGSAIDSAKSIAVMACNEGDYWDYIHGGTGKGKAPVGGALPIVSIPTTAGTGTEIDPWTVVTHNEEKIGYGFDGTFPVVSIVDPELMVSVPAMLTAYQGFDAFFHAAEGYIANCATPVSELYSLKSIELIYKSLAKAVANGEDIEARGDVALASTLAGMVESTSSCTSEHSIAHAMSAVYPTMEHGAALTAISIAYFKSFIEACPERLCAMATAMTGEPCNNPQQFIDALAAMQRACGVDNITLSNWGMTPSDFEMMAQKAFETMGGLFALDRCQLSQSDVVKILADSYR